MKQPYLPGFAPPRRTASPLVATFFPDGRRTLRQRHEVPTPRCAIFQPNYGGTGVGVWLLSCELVTSSEAEARHWVEHGVEPGCGGTEDT